MEAKYCFWPSTAAAVATTICLKTLAWKMTGSMPGLDAIESFVNLGASFALWMITIAKVPPDENHPGSHSKAVYFSSGFEGLLIFSAAGRRPLYAGRQYAFGLLLWMVAFCRKAGTRKR